MVNKDRNMSEFLKIGFNQSDCFSKFYGVKNLKKHGEKGQIVGYINTNKDYLHGQSGRSGPRNDELSSGSVSERATQYTSTLYSDTK